MTNRRRKAVIAVAGVILVVIAGVSLALRSRNSRSGTTATAPSAAVTMSSSLNASPDRCHTSQLAAAFVETQGAAGSSVGTFGLTNTSSTTCMVSGFPGIALIGNSGREAVPPPARDRGRPASPVTLAPGQQAEFLLQWGNPVNGTGCFTVSKVVITPPNETDSLEIQAVDANGTKVSPCGNGTTFVQPVRPATAH